MKKKIIFATGNEGKMKEIRTIMADMDWELLSQKEAGLEADIQEDGTTFQENAVIKAKAIARILREKGETAVVLADDSGLEIDYLNKEPGIFSARYMGENTSYDIKNAAILERLAGVEDRKRTARFVCVVAAVMPNGESFTASGIMEGKIGYEIRGSQGFGYDPIFIPQEYHVTAAELTMEQKNMVSHRGRALRAMKEKLGKVMETYSE